MIDPKDTRMDEGLDEAALAAAHDAVRDALGYRHGNMVNLGGHHIDFRAVALAAVNAYRRSTIGGEPVGFVTEDALAEVAAGRIGNHIFPAGTLRPENEVPVYRHPAPSTGEGVKVKPIPWRPKGGGTNNNLYSGELAFNTYYTVEEAGPLWRVWRGQFLSEAGQSEVGAVADLEAAKALAQADYEARIKSALLHPSIGDSEAGAGWQPIDTAPHACHVMAARWDECEWVYGVVMSPPGKPWTHWQHLPSPPELRALSTQRETAK